MWNFKKYEFNKNSSKSCNILIAIILLIGIYLLGFIIFNIVLILSYYNNYENYIDDMVKLYNTKLIYFYIGITGIITIIIYKILELMYNIIKSKKCNVVYPL